MAECIFCRIVKGEIPCNRLYENDKVLAFLDISPANKGHTLVISKSHFVTLDEMPEETAVEMMKAAHKLSKPVVKATGCDGYNVMLNNHPASGQEVPHAHIHIMPRFNSDDFTFRWTHKKYEAGEMEKYMDKIISLL